MKKNLFLSLIAFGWILNTFGQYASLEVTFTATNNASYIKLDSIKVMNQTHAGDTVLFYPDTVLVLEYATGIHELSNRNNALRVFQNRPNPVRDQTIITLYVPRKDIVKIMITDLFGRQLIHKEYMLDKGYHSFRFVPGEESLYFITAQWENQVGSIKIIHLSNESSQPCALEYLTSDPDLTTLKMTKPLPDFSFNLGDHLLYIGYTNSRQSGIPDSPSISDTFTFQYATNIPCPSVPSVTYEGQVYTTIQIFSQCWLKENLNVGTMIPGTQVMANNGIIEKYCYSNDTNNCSTYGGLYVWDEAMQYATIEGVQGICPPGWHIPSDADWKVLEGSVDSQYGIGDTTWNIWGVRGFDAGKNLKSTTLWYGGNGTDLFGFSGKPGGMRDGSGSFDVLHYEGFCQSSKVYDISSSWYRSLRQLETGSNRDWLNRDFGYSVRCLKDN